MRKLKKVIIPWVQMHNLKYYDNKYYETKYIENENWILI